MKKLPLLMVAAVLMLAAAALAAGAEEHHRMVVALITDDFELPETDLSHLEIGDAETVYTQSGKTVDLLRTEDGIEIYVDGELLETGWHGDRLHEGHHIVHEHLEIECESESDCESEHLELEALHEGGHHEKVIVIRKDAESD